MGSLEPHSPPRLHLDLRTDRDRAAETEYVHALTVAGQEFPASASDTSETGVTNPNGPDFLVRRRNDKARRRAMIDDGVTIASKAKCGLGVVENPVYMVPSQGHLPEMMLIEMRPGNKGEVLGG